VLVSFVDLAPHGPEPSRRAPPQWMQGQAFGTSGRSSSTFMASAAGWTSAMISSAASATAATSTLRNYLPYKLAGQLIEHLVTNLQ
jgi:hypothetical protein